MAGVSQGLVSKWERGRDSPSEAELRMLEVAFGESPPAPGTAKAEPAKLQYRGRWLILDVQAGPVAQIEIHCRSKFHVVVPEALEDLARLLEAIRAAFADWLRNRAERDLFRFGRHHQARLGVEAKAFRLSQAKRRWGSCGRDGVIRVHWRLIQAPRVAMEYVVAHELAHLVHRNHSPAFWLKLAETMPEWAKAKELLERWERQVS